MKKILSAQFSLRRAGLGLPLRPTAPLRQCCVSVALGAKRQAKACPTGFTLMEVMAAIAIFAIGMVAVAALYPAALSIQRATIDQAQATQAKRNARAIITARQIILSNDTNINQFPITPANSQVNQYPDGSVHKFENTTDGAFFGINAWTLGDRAYPAATTNAANGKASYYWLPFFKDNNGDLSNGTPTNPDDDAGDITIYIAVLQAQQNKNYSGGVTNLYGATQTGLAGMAELGVSNVSPFSVDVTIPTSLSSSGYSLSDILSPSDEVLLNDGTVITVSAINGNTIKTKDLIKPPLPGLASITGVWVGVPFAPGDANPVKAIFQLSGSQAVRSLP